MIEHFEDLWVKCESFNHEVDNDTKSIIDELILKVNVYKTIDQKMEIDKVELEAIKSRTLGEILLTLTALSDKENIDVFAALNIALQYRSRQ